MVTSMLHSEMAPKYDDGVSERMGGVWDNVVSMMSFLAWFDATHSPYKLFNIYYCSRFT